MSRRLEGRGKCVDLIMKLTSSLRSAHKCSISTNTWTMKYSHLASSKLSWSLKLPFLVRKDKVRMGIGGERNLLVLYLDVSRKADPLDIGQGAELT